MTKRKRCVLPSRDPFIYTCTRRPRGIGPRLGGEAEVDVPQEAETIVRFRREMKRRRDDLFEER